MFIGRETTVRVQPSNRVVDSFNHWTTQWTAGGYDVKMYITIQDRSFLTNNDMDRMKVTAVGYSTNGSIWENDLINYEYVVKSKIPHKNMWVYYLEGLEDGK